MIKNKFNKIMTYILSVMMMFAMIPAIVNVEAVAPEQIKKVQTVDTASLIDMTMYDYFINDQDYRVFETYWNSTPFQIEKNKEDYGESQNLLEKHISDTDAGIPKTNTNSKNVSDDYKGKLIPYFDDNNNKINKKKYSNLNNLFLQSTYDSTGYFEYSSFKNFATLVNDRGVIGSDFTVYNAIVKPNGKSANKDNYFYRRGNFLPFNTINKTSHEIVDIADEYGDETGTKDYIYDNNGNTNYNFGLKLEANFMQLKDGQVQVPNSNELNDMIYTFNGDDDLWVYIDNVLILDIGGIHDASTGTINFADGTVHIDFSNGDKTGIQNTTIKQLFKEAGYFPDGNVWDDTKVDLYFDGETFVDYSNHNLKMFYMERGQGASNLHMKFNLPLVPAGTLQVGKQLDEFTSSYIYGNVLFGFKLEVIDENGNATTVTREYCEDNEYNPFVGELNDTTGDKLTWNEAGDIFYIHPNEYAIFKNIPENTKYQVTEVDVKSDEFDEVTISGTDFVASGDEITESGSDIQSDIYTVGLFPTITFVNKVSVSNKRTLKVTKQMESGYESKDTFNILVQFKNSSGEFVPYNGSYTVKNTNDSQSQGDTKNTTNGIITLTANQSAYIYNILSETEFQVSESVSGNYKEPTYQVNTKLNSQNSYYESGNTGEIELKNDAEVIVTNSYKLGSLTIKKKITNINDVDLNNGDPIFTFVIENDNAGIKLYKTIRFSELTSDTKFISIENLPYGVYTIYEENIFRYTCTSSNPVSVTINKAEGNTANFENTLTNKNNFSDTDYIENYFKVENGTGKITWQKKTSSSEKNTD